MDLSSEIAEHPLAELVARTLETMSDDEFGTRCGHAFHAITRCWPRDVDALWITADRSSMRGSAAGWTMEIRLGVDADYGKSDHALTISGRLSLGETHIDSISVTGES